MTDQSPDKLLADILSQMQAAGDPERAAQSKRYMKSERAFYGVKKPVIDAYAKQFYQATKKLPAEDLIPHIARLYASPNFDEATLGVSIARLHQRAFTTAHLSDPIESWFNTCEGWSHCDELATRCAGMVVFRDMENAVPIIYGWRHSPHMWTRRASMLCHFPGIRKTQAPLDLLFDTFTTLLDEDEFFIQKAIGWTLREMSRRYPDEVLSYIRNHQGEMSKLAFKEGSRNLPDEMQAQLAGA